MAGAGEGRRAASASLETVLAETDRQETIGVLDASIPEGADIGEMIVHASPELTLLYARVPPGFQSAIHNHTIFACIGRLAGEELGTIYERSADGQGLSVVTSVSLKAGQVTSLPEDAIHHIENPGDSRGAPFTSMAAISARSWT
jgi:predicted metal-dependent enzyme (double-stranded beta helix superfamily)